MMLSCCIDHEHRTQQEINHETRSTDACCVQEVLPKLTFPLDSLVTPRRPAINGFFPDVRPA